METSEDATAGHEPASRRPRRRHLIGFGIFAVALAVSFSAALVRTASSDDGVLPSLYSLNERAMYSTRQTLTVGDEGVSPFFRPGVVIWDGGSILGGAGVGADFSPSAQTLRLLPRSVTSHFSITHNALIGRMHSEAPGEIDARYTSPADAAVCVVMAGGADLRIGRDAGSTYARLRTYCAARRAAGFQVVVVTLLPRTTPADFETRRLEFNGRIRSTWAEFADGLADIGADPRLGDAFDNLDRRYYQKDALHPNAAGYAVMATVLAPVLGGLEWESNGCEMRRRNAGGAWTPWHDYSSRSSWMVSAGDGTKTVETQYRDREGTVVTLADSIVLDTRGPRTTALRAVRVRSGRTAALPYRVDDRGPGATTTVTIVLRQANGRIVARLSLGAVASGREQTAFYACGLRPATYRYFVHARDAAGNHQERIGSARLTVH